MFVTHALFVGVALAFHCYCSAVVWLFAVVFAFPFFASVRQILEHRSASASCETEFSKELHGPVNRMFGKDPFSQFFGAAGFNRHMLHPFERELEIDPFNVLARYKLGVLAIERGDGARAKELIEGALKQKSGLHHADYNLGRAEMLLGQDESALKHFQTATATENDPEVLQQSWYQLGITLRRLHRMAEAQQAIATFQRLKNEQAEKSQEQLKKFKVQQDADVARPENSNPE